MVPPEAYHGVKVHLSFPWYSSGIRSASSRLSDPTSFTVRRARTSPSARLSQTSHSNLNNYYYYTPASQFTLDRQPNLSSGRLPGTRLQRAPQTSECLLSATEGRANSICRRSAPSQQCPQHHLPEWEEPRSAGVAGRNPQDGGTHHVPIRVPDSFSKSVAHSSSPVVSPYHLCLWSGRGRPWCPYPEVSTRR
jgi:hypothetical protein